MIKNLNYRDYIKLIEETHSKWKSGEITAVMFMEMLELKKKTFYKIMKEYEENKYRPNKTYEPNFA
ncbi:integrase [Bacillus toyonensis]|nr:integrase [Bacillus toyonensis]PHG27772.1 integrase [Bacillus toyonensis]